MVSILSFHHFRSTMGRLLKKKPVAQKKKKLSKATDVKIDKDAEATENATASLTLVSGKDAKRKPADPGRKAASAVKAGSGPIKKNFIDKSLQFLREVKVELKKVTWPSRKQTIGSTIVVLVLVLIISLFLGVIDMGLSKLVQLVLQ